MVVAASGKASSNVLVFSWLAFITIWVACLSAVTLSVWRTPPPPSAILRRGETGAQASARSDGSTTCSADSCGAIDPVNDPDYNMREVIKNTVLIEQHLSEPNKYCKQCIVKHFLISIALLEEAVWMAGARRGEYPMLEDSLPFYRSTFEAWIASPGDLSIRVQTLDKLRGWRRDASEKYFPTGG